MKVTASQSALGTAPPPAATGMCDCELENGRDEGDGDGKRKEARPVGRQMRASALEKTVTGRPGGPAAAGVGV
jgi:hypothetical protein